MASWGAANLAGKCGVTEILNAALMLSLKEWARLAQSRVSSSISSGLVVAIVAASVLTDCSSPETTRDERDVALAANVEAFATKLAASDEFSGVAFLTRHGQPLVRRGHGLADRKTARPNTPETAFMLSSVSKMFTAVTIAKLVERKQLSFDSTLGSLLPEYPSAEARDVVTVRHLLTMSSGIPDLFRVPEFWAQAATLKSAVDFWRFFATSPLQFRPGTQWSYSNSNFLLLGTIIERQTGRPFISVVEAELFRPLGLARTRYEVGGSPQPALGYTRTPPAGVPPDSARWYPAWEEPKPGDECIPCTPMGGGYSTADDPARFADGAEAIAAHVRALLTSSARRNVDARSATHRLGSMKRDANSATFTQAAWLASDSN